MELFNNRIIISFYNFIIGDSMIKIVWKSVNKKDSSDVSIIKLFHNLTFMRDYLVDPADVGENNGSPVLVSKRLMKFFHDYLINSENEFYDDNGKISNNYYIMEEFSDSMLNKFDWNNYDLFITCTW